MRRKLYRSCIKSQHDAGGRDERDQIVRVSSKYGTKEQVGSWVRIDVLVRYVKCKNNKEDGLYPSYVGPDADEAELRQIWK